MSARRAILSAEWRYLVMLNYEIVAEVLAPFVPAGTVLDLHDGRVRISVVGFRFLRTRVLGIRLGAGATVVTIMVDSGLRYLSTDLYSESAQC